MKIQRDGKDQPFIEWAVGGNGYKRAWIQRRADPDKDWAKSGRYLNVVRIEAFGKGAGRKRYGLPDLFKPARRTDT